MLRMAIHQKLTQSVYFYCIVISVSCLEVPLWFINFSSGIRRTWALSSVCFFCFLCPLDIFSFQGRLNCATVYVNFSSPASNCSVQPSRSVRSGAQIDALPSTEAVLFPTVSAWNVLWKSYKINNQSFKLNTFWVGLGDETTHRTLAHFCLRLWVITSPGMPALCRLAIY